MQIQKTKPMFFHIITTNFTHSQETPFLYVKKLLDTQGMRKKKKKWIPQISVQAQIDGLAFQFLHSKKTVCAHRTIQRGFTYRKLEVFRFSSQSLP
jgi:hypothetical protein